MNMPLFLTLCLFFASVCLWLGKRAAAKTETKEDYFLMGRKIGLLSLSMTLLATQVGGGALMGAAEEAYVRGWSVLFYPLGMVCGMLIIGLGYGAKMRSMNLTTISELFEKVYRSYPLRRIASLLSIASLFFILAGQAIAARKFFFSVGLEGNHLFIAFWVLLILYTVMGGLRAVVQTDIFQAGFIMAAFGLACFVSLSKELPEHTAMLPTMDSGAPIFTWLLMPLLFMLIEQDMGQRCFAAKNPRTVSSAALLSAALLLIVSIAPIYFGVTASKLGLLIPKNASVLMFSVRVMTNPVVATLLIFAILMAIVSTADSLLCSISSNIACDFPLFKQSLFSSRAITALTGLATLLFAFYFDNVVAMLMFSYELSVSVLFVPITLAVVRKNPHKYSAVASMIMGFLCFLTFRSWIPPIPKEILCLAFSLTAFFISELIFNDSKQKVSNVN